MINNSVMLHWTFFRRWIKSHSKKTTRTLLFLFLATEAADGADQHDYRVLEIVKGIYYICWQITESQKTAFFMKPQIFLLAFEYSLNRQLFFFFFFYIPDWDYVNTACKLWRSMCNSV